MHDIQNSPLYIMHQDQPHAHISIHILIFSLQMHHKLHHFQNPQTMSIPPAIYTQYGLCPSHLHFCPNCYPQPSLGLPNHGSELIKDYKMTCNPKVIQRYRHYRVFVLVTDQFKEVVPIRWIVTSMVTQVIQQEVQAI
jgi:hypothetical protein